MTANHILWITTLAMLTGGLAILAIGRRRTPSEALRTALHGIAPIIAACAYLAMATGQGLALLPTIGAIQSGQMLPARIFYFARYLGWIFAMPLLLASLGLTATRHGIRRPGAVAGAALANGVMVVAAFAFGASLQAWTKWIWFAVSCAALLGVYYVIWVTQMEASATQRGDIKAAYRREAAILSVLWLLYPIVLAVSPDGLGAIGDAAGVLLFAIVDLATMVAYGLASIRSDAAITDRDLAIGERTPH